METTGLLKGTGFITKKERDGDEVYESNHAKVTLEIALDELSSEDLDFLARNQNQAIEIEFAPTYRASTRRTRREDPAQLTIDDAERENERVAKIRRVLYFAIEGMPEVPADASVEQLSIALCDWFRERVAFEVDECLYAVGTGESGMCPQLFTVTADGQDRALVIEAAELIDHVRWILSDKPESTEAHFIFKVDIAPHTDFGDEEGHRVTICPGEGMSWTIEKQLPDGLWCVYPDTVAYKTESEARDALQSLGLEKNWTPIAPDGYGAVYRTDLDESQIEETWMEGARVAIFYVDDNGAGEFCSRGLYQDAEGNEVGQGDMVLIPGGSTKEEAQKNLDDYAQKEGWCAMFFVDLSHLDASINDTVEQTIEVITNTQEPENEVLEAKVYEDGAGNRYYVVQDGECLGMTYSVEIHPFGKSSTTRFAAVEPQLRFTDAQQELDKIASVRGWEVYEPPTQQAAVNA